MLWHNKYGTDRSPVVRWIGRRRLAWSKCPVRALLKMNQPGLRSQTDSSSTRGPPTVPLGGMQIDSCPDFAYAGLVFVTHNAPVSTEGLECRVSKFPRTGM
jgi:hypothetical protein